MGPLTNGNLIKTKVENTVEEAKRSVLTFKTNGYLKFSFLTVGTNPSQNG